MRENIYNTSFAELKSFFIDLNEKAFRAEQLWNWLYVKGIDELSGLNNISRNINELAWEAQEKKLIALYENLIRFEENN